MRSVIIVHPSFDYVWPVVADHMHALWREQGEVEFIRLDPDEKRTLGELVPEPGSVTRLIALCVEVTAACFPLFTQLEEVAVQASPYDAAAAALLEPWTTVGVKVYQHKSEGFWGQSVSEFALALTLCGLRRIPQAYHQMLTDLNAWYYPYDPVTKIGEQVSEDSHFASGTVEGKRVRIIGAGNIASRYASFVNMLGADVAAWDPYASEPCFHRAGARREMHLSQLVQDADIFVPMVPLTDHTKLLIKAEHIRALPKGCMVVLVTRAGICDMDALRERVLNDELSLAADVFDIEPVPLDDPLLGRHNVVHTPHLAGRTVRANERWGEMLLEQFIPR